MGTSGMGTAGSASTAPTRRSILQKELPVWLAWIFITFAYLFGVAYFSLMALSASLAPEPLYRWKFLLGPGLSFFVLAVFPPYRGDSMRAHIHFILMTAFCVPFAIHAATHLNGVFESLLHLPKWSMAGPYEEGLKLVCVLFLAWTTTKARNWPTRLVLIGLGVGVLFSGVETAWGDKLPTLHQRGVFGRIISMAKHGLYTAIAASGLGIAAYLSRPWRWLVPFSTWGLGAGLHYVGNTYHRPIHARLLYAVDDLPNVMTREQWFNAPHYDSLHYAVFAGYVLILLCICAALMALTFRLARHGGWTPPTGERHPRQAE